MEYSGNDIKLNGYYYQIGTKVSNAYFFYRNGVIKYWRCKR